MKKILFIILATMIAMHASAQIGIYDIQASWGINFTKPKKNLPFRGEIGTDYDLGFTLLNLPYTREYSFNAEVHYDYSRQNFSSTLGGDLKFRRHEFYTRLRPLGFNPKTKAELVSMIQMVITGLYVDVGYTKGAFFYEDYLDNVGPSYSQHGFFWGYGYNMVFRIDKLGLTVGYGSKKYSWTGAQSQNVQYSSRSFQFGMFYTL